VITYTHAVAPEAPTAPTTTVSGSTINVAWTAPAANGAAITSYVLKFKQNDGIFSTSASTVSTTGSISATIPTSVLKAAPYSLPIGGVIKATVVAVNRVGSSATSVEGGAAVIPNTIPDAPTIFAENVEFRTKTGTGLTWTPPSFNGGSVIT